MSTRPERAVLHLTARLVTGVVALAAALLLAGCGHPASGPAAETTPPAASLSDLTQAFLQYAQCARTHGLPDLPDPVVDVMGNDSYPGFAGGARPRWPESVLTGCATVWDHVHAVRSAYDASHGRPDRGSGAMTPAQALAFSRCIRQHGFPTYPDPGPDGTIANPPPGFDKAHLSEAAKAGIIACQAQVTHG
jgi:hypothetical protein